MSGPCPARFWWVLDNPLRRLVADPAKVVGLLGLSPDSRVLEVGPGPGFFSAEIAKRTGHSRLQAVDIQRKMLLRARYKLRTQFLWNVDCVQADAMALPYADRSFDGALLVTVLGEVQNRAFCLREVWRVLKPGGLLVVSELRVDPHYISRPVLHELARRERFDYDYGSNRPWGYTHRFRKPEVTDLA
jgi:ubiquinone/menaquinone biosynthesis C-methylase UbiE